MARKQHQHHYIYRIACLINNRYYIGMHSTSNLDDDYFGGGIKIKNSIKKYGKENHTREMLEFFTTREDLVKREIELVNEDLLKDPLCMNINLGGDGGWLLEWQRKGAKATNEKNWKDPRFIEKIKKVGSKTFKRLWEENKLSTPDWTGKTHSEESKLKIGISNSGKQKGERNSQFGTFWINNGEINKKIKKEGLTLYETKGWKRGRI
jgi:hypothetical protein